jgi:chemotaxis protein CheX
MNRTTMVDYQAMRPMLELSVREVFQIMLGCKIEAGAESAEAEKFDFTSMVGLAGQLTGVVTLRCSSEAAAMMASMMLGTKVGEGDQQLWDATGEICNMVAGNFKNKLSGVSDSCMLSVPTVITGGDYTFHSLADGSELQIHLSFENLPMVVALQLND